MRRLLILFAVLLLGSCFGDQKQQVAKCELEAMRQYPGKELASSNEIGMYMITCMRANGYDWNLMDKRCPAASFTIQRVPYCYTPSGWLGRLGYRIETVFD
jgi:hypothetical protein